MGKQSTIYEVHNWLNVGTLYAIYTGRPVTNGLCSFRSSVSYQRRRCSVMLVCVRCYDETRPAPSRNSQVIYFAPFNGYIILSGRDRGISMTGASRDYKRRCGTVCAKNWRKNWRLQCVVMWCGAILCVILYRLAGNTRNASITITALAPAAARRAWA